MTFLFQKKVSAPLIRGSFLAFIDLSNTDSHASPVRTKSCITDSLIKAPFTPSIKDKFESYTKPGACTEATMESICKLLSHCSSQS